MRPDRYGIPRLNWSKPNDVRIDDAPRAARIVTTNSRDAPCRNAFIPYFAELARQKGDCTNRSWTSRSSGCTRGRIGRSTTRRAAAARSCRGAYSRHPVARARRSTAEYSAPPEGVGGADQAQGGTSLGYHRVPGRSRKTGGRNSQAGIKHSSRLGYHDEKARQRIVRA